MKRREFTFSIVSYKHREYIISHLFSIKNLVDQYGLGWDNHFLLLDDNSKDGTVDAVRKWIDENPIFNSVEIIENPSNYGTVHNFIKINKSIRSGYFKLLAADDLYYKNNVYEAVRQGELNITPTIRFRDDRVIDETIWGNYKMMAKREKLKPALIDQFKECWIIETPGTFYDIEYVNDSLLDSLNNFKYVEDVAFFHSLICETNIEVYFNPKIYVLYRMGGISTSKRQTPLVKKYNEEGDLLNDDIFIRSKKLSSGRIDIYRYYQSIRWRYYEYLLPRINFKMRLYEQARKKELSVAQGYLDGILEQAKNWEREHEL